MANREQLLELIDGMISSLHIFKNYITGNDLQGIEDFFSKAKNSGTACLNSRAWHWLPITTCTLMWKIDRESSERSQRCWVNTV